MKPVLCGCVFSPDVDECLDKLICGEHATCKNTVGGFLCPCHDGYNASGPALAPGGLLACVGTSVSSDCMQYGY